MQPCTARPDWIDDPVGDRQQRAARAATLMRENIPASRAYFDDAYGYAVFPGIGRAALGFGGAYGKGIVVEQGTVIGHSGYWQFSSGIQAGARVFSMIIFFKDQADFERFAGGTLELMAQAGVSFLTLGADGTPAYSEGVAIFVRPGFGLMFEISISGARFSFKPMPGVNP